MTDWPKQVTDPNLSTADDVRAWFRALHDAGVNFHPDDKFGGIVDLETGERSFTRFEAARMGVALNSARMICRAEGVDIYKIGTQSLMAHLGRPGA